MAREVTEATPRKLVSLGEGRVIEMKEEVTGTPPVPQEPKKPKAPRKVRKNTKKPPTRSSAFKRKIVELPGFNEWAARTHNQITQFLGKPGFKSRTRFGIPDGMTKKQSDKAWAKAREQVKEDMANLAKAGLVGSDDDLVKEATEATLLVMRGPMNQDMALRAARQILDFYKSRPVTKTETTVNAAEAWLASLAEKDNG